MGEVSAIISRLFKRTISSATKIAPSSTDVDKEATKYASDIIGEYDPELQEEFDNIKKHFIAGANSTNHVRPVVDDSEEFAGFMSNSRDVFVKEINEQKWNTKLRTTAEDFLVCFDQVRNRLADSCLIKEPIVSKQTHPESHCPKCKRLNPVWSAENDLWNEVNGSPDGIVCPSCFGEMAEEKGVDVYFRATRTLSVQGDGKCYEAVPVSDKPTKNGNYGVMNESGATGYHSYVNGKWMEQDIANATHWLRPVPSIPTDLVSRLKDELLDCKTVVEGLMNCSESKLCDGCKDEINRVLKTKEEK